MAFDEALMAYAYEHDVWVLRAYSWQRPTVSFGRNQSARAAYDPGRISASGTDVVRRPTGGRALLHAHEVTYSVTGPLRQAGSLRAVYAEINAMLLVALRTLGVDAVIADVRTRYAVPPGAAPCFDHPAPGEIVVQGRKLAGSAQWRDERALLQHGSIIVTGDQSAIATWSTGPLAPPPPPATLAGLLGHQPTFDAVALALFDATRATFDADAQPFSPDGALPARIASLADRYRDPSWTWRR